MNKPCSIPVVASTANNKYALPLAILLKSLEQKLNDGETVIVYILFSEFDEALKSELERNIDNEKLALNWIKIDPGITEGLKTSYWWTLDVYYRILLEQLLPQHDKVIYLDADIIVNRSIYEMWEMDIDNWHLMAIPHATKEAGLVTGRYGLPVYKVLGIPETTRTFNSGVLVIHLKLWRRDQICRSIFNYLREYEDHVLWLDQDALNAVLYSKWKEIPYEWNVQLEDFSAAMAGAVDAFLTQRECMRIMMSPALIHFAGSKKPWLPGFNGLFKDHFFHYMDQLSPSLLEACSRHTEIIKHERVFTAAPGAVKPAT